MKIQYTIVALRAKDMNHDWITGHFIQHGRKKDKDSVYLMFDERYCAGKIDPNTLGRVLAVSDIHNKNFCEDDIVRDIDTQEVFVLNKNHYLFYAMLACPETITLGQEIGKERRLEIIGNVYDNPELL